MNKEQIQLKSIYTVGIIVMAFAGYHILNEEYRARKYEPLQPGDFVVASAAEYALIRRPDDRITVQVAEGNLLNSDACDAIVPMSDIQASNKCKSTFSPLTRRSGRLGPRQVNLKPGDYSDQDLITLLGSGYEHRTTQAERDAAMLRILAGTIGFTALIAAIPAVKKINDILETKARLKEAAELQEARDFHSKQQKALIRSTEPMEKFKPPLKASKEQIDFFKQEHEDNVNKESEAESKKIKAERESFDKQIAKNREDLYKKVKKEMGKY